MQKQLAIKLISLTQRLVSPNKAHSTNDSLQIRIFSLRTTFCHVPVLVNSDRKTSMNLQNRLSKLNQIFNRS